MKHEGANKQMIYPNLKPKFMKIIMIKRRVKNCHFRAVLHIGPGGSLKLWSEFSISLIEWKQCDQVFYRPFSRILYHANTSCFEYPGNSGDTWRPYLGHLEHLRVGAPAIFGTPTHIHCTHKMWPECWTLLGTPLPSPWIELEKIWW